MHLVNSMFAILTTVMLLVIWRGIFAWAMRRERDATMHLALGLSALLWAVVFRVIYWDVVPQIVDWFSPGRWEEWVTLTGWTRINILWDLLLIFGGYHMLKALHLMIPEEERADWPLWRAPFYPHGSVIDRLVRWWRK